MGTTRKTLSVYWQESLKQPKQLLGVLLLWPVGMALQNLLLPLVAAKALNRLVDIYHTGQTNYWHIFTPYIVSFIIIAIAGQFATTYSLLLLARLEIIVRQRIENNTYKWLLGHSLSFHANSFSGSLVAQATRFAGAYVSISDSLIVTGLQIVVRSVVAIIIIAFFSVPIAAVILVWSILFTLLNIHLTKRRIHLSRIAAQADSVITGHLADSMGNINVIKAFARENNEEKVYAAKTKDRGIKKYRSWHRAVKNGMWYSALMNVLQLTVLLLSIYAIMHHQIQIGTLLLIQSYITQLIGQLWELGTLMRNVEQSLSDASEMTEILFTPQEVTDPAKPQKSRIAQGAISFEHMDFTHGDTKKDDALFHDFNLHIKAGEKIGLVGHSGSGKTTLTRLLLRFSDVDAGSIVIDNQNIAKITQADVRKAIAYVPQEPLLFHRSLRENVAYGKPDATDEEIRAAAKKAYATEFIDKLPHGYDTLVGERGVKLSGGQRQRIAIARAILKDAPILVLDEATSALDSDSEKLIQAALTDLMKHRTAIVIAHRLSTVQKMDRIVVLENGKIIEQGTHKELVAKKGTYADLWKHQSGGFIEE